MGLRVILFYEKMRSWNWVIEKCILGIMEPKQGLSLRQIKEYIYQGVSESRHAKLIIFWLNRCSISCFYARLFTKSIVLLYNARWRAVQLVLVLLWEWRGVYFMEKVHMYISIFAFIIFVAFVYEFICSYQTWIDSISFLWICMFRLKRNPKGILRD